jgi:CRISPR-associated protein Cas1
VKQYQNTLFVTTEGAYLSHEGESVVVRVDGNVRLRVPLHTLGSIVCFGGVGVTPPAMGLCAERGVTLTFLTSYGRFVARVQGPVSGNVLLRRAQYRRADDPDGASAVARAVVSGKIANARTVLLRTARDRPEGPSAEALAVAARSLEDSLGRLDAGMPLDSVRGVEGDASRVYFGVFDHLIAAQKDAFFFRERSRRPPLDNMNALLSFLYAMLANDAASALETVGLDPAVGFLHRDRPGRPGLALDLMEEFRAFLADRVALSLVNLRQVAPSGLRKAEGGGVEMDDATRKEVLVAYQKRKQEEITHPFLGEKTTVGLLIYLQAMLMARFIRGDMDGYPPFIWK